MVIKQKQQESKQQDKFESSVISYGNQTDLSLRSVARLFESSVISYGNQTKYKYRLGMVWFESSVISYGNQTRIIWRSWRA